MIPRLILVLLPFLALSACRDEHEWHQKLTVTVATPAGEVSGAAVSAVTNVYTDGAWVLMEARGVRSTIEGEAVVVEVAPGRFLFALLGGAGGWSYSAFGLDQERSYDAAMDKLMNVPHDTLSPLPVEDYPLLVTFADINDPTTVARVDPTDLAASFGPGVSLTAVTLEVTDDPVTEGRVEAVLGWLGFYKKNQWRLNGENCIACPVTSDRLADLTHPSDFLTWGK